MFKFLLIPFIVNSLAAGTCPQSPSLSLHEKNRTLPLKIFVSSSMPAASLKALHQQAVKIGGRLIFRGLINNSFKDTQAYFKDLGISADIDPPKFEEHHVTRVPTFILGEHQLQGNITVEEALSHLKESRP